MALLFGLDARISRGVFKPTEGALRWALVAQRRWSPKYPRNFKNADGRRNYNPLTRNAVSVGNGYPRVERRSVGVHVLTYPRGALCIALSPAAPHRAAVVRRQRPLRRPTFVVHLTCAADLAEIPRCHTCFWRTELRTAAAVVQTTRCSATSPTQPPSTDSNTISGTALSSIVYCRKGKVAVD